MTDRPGKIRPAEAARFLRQQVEMGASEVFLNGVTREELLAAAAVAHADAPTRPDRGALTSDPVATRPQKPPAASAPERPEAAGKTPTKPSAKAVAQPSSECTPLPTLPDDYDALTTIAQACTACALSQSRTQVVFSDGSPSARLMVVGEAPGANEDATGLPFVGAAGKYLDLLLAMVDLSRSDSVYIANVLKCRPPGNRDPQPVEIETCSPILRKQIDLVKPEALLAVGSFSARLLTGREKSPLGKLRGEVHSYHGVPLVVTYHPAALLRNPNWTRAFWEDLQLLRNVMDAV